MQVFPRFVRHLRRLTEAVTRVVEDGYPTAASRWLVRAMAAVLMAVVVFRTLATHASTGDADRSRLPVAVETGAVCKSLTDRRHEVSCGRTAFGDVRFNCTAGVLGKCLVTTEVTLRNVGHVSVKVTLVSGRHEDDRRLSPTSEVEPGRTVTLRPHRDEELLDILVRSIESGVGVLQVVSVE